MQKVEKDLLFPFPRILGDPGKLLSRRLRADKRKDFFIQHLINLRNSLPEEEITFRGIRPWLLAMDDISRIRSCMSPNAEDE